MGGGGPGPAASSTRALEKTRKGAHGRHRVYRRHEAFGGRPARSSRRGGRAGCVLVARHGRGLAAANARTLAPARDYRGPLARPRPSGDASALSGRGRALVVIHDRAWPRRLLGG